jgi:zinc protease
VSSAGAIAAPQNVDKAIAAAMEEIRGFLGKGAPPAEFEKAKTAWRKSFENQLASDRWIVSALAAALHEDRTLEKDQHLANAIAKLTAERMLQVARKHLVPERLVKVRAGDWKKATPAAP